MTLAFFKTFRSRQSRHVDAVVARDADDLIRLWGAGAYDHATYLSWCEDSGLMPSSRRAHWWSVRREIERRLGGDGAAPQGGDAASSHVALDRLASIK